MALEVLYVPTSAPWYASFVSELLSFPAGKHDDALGLVGQLRDRMVKGRKPKPVRLTIDTWRETWDQVFKRHCRKMRQLREMESEARALRLNISRMNRRLSEAPDLPGLQDSARRRS
jgi:hypothetical protein